MAVMAALSLRLFDVCGSRRRSLLVKNNNNNNNIKRMKKRRGTFFLIFLFLFSAPHNKRQGLGVMNVYCATVSPLLLLFFLEPPLFFIVKKKKSDSPGKRRVVCSYTNEKWPLRASPENYFYISSVASLFFWLFSSRCAVARASLFGRCRRHQHIILFCGVC